MWIRPAKLLVAPLSEWASLMSRICLHSVPGWCLHDGVGRSVRQSSRVAAEWANGDDDDDYDDNAGAADAREQGRHEICFPLCDNDCLQRLRSVYEVVALWSGAQFAYTYIMNGRLEQREKNMQMVYTRSAFAWCRG